MTTLSASSLSSAVLSHAPSNLINGRFVPIEGDRVRSFNPARPSECVWSGSPKVEHVDEAVAAARAAQPAWAASSLEDRTAVLREWARLTTVHAERIAGLITDENGKVMAEALFEAKALAEKVDITLSQPSLLRVAGYEVAVNATRSGRCRFKPHGVMVVIGPFNFPAHLANGQFVPALLMGDTIVFKPSEKTPAVGQLIAELMHEAITNCGAPAGIFNLVQGGPEVASRLVTHEDVDGILFTGSWPVGRRILEANLDRPGRIIALEMGGNNPAVVMDDAHLKQAVIECARSAFATTGQRCTCTRRIMVQRGVADRFIAVLCKAASTLLVGPGRSQTPVFMGPLISDPAKRAVIQFQRSLVERGGRVLVPATEIDTFKDGAGHSGHFITPAVVQVDGFSLEHDVEVFGPLVQVMVVDSLDEAIHQSNQTRYGLAASIFTASESQFERYFHNVRAGCINWNTGTAGASSKLPFGGLGQSGNHRPAGAFAADACAYPVAAMVETSTDAALPAGMMFDEKWV